MPPPRTGQENLLSRLVSFARDSIAPEVQTTREGIKSVTALNKAVPLIVVAVVILIVVTLGKK